MEFYPSQYSQDLPPATATEPELPKKQKIQTKTVLRWGAALAILGALLAVRYLNLQITARIREVFLPKQPEAVSAAAMNLAEQIKAGTSLSQAVKEFLRELISHVL